MNEGMTWEVFLSLFNEPLFWLVFTSVTLAELAGHSVLYVVGRLGKFLGFNE